MRLRSSWVMRIRLKPRWVRMLRVHSSVLLRYNSRVTTSGNQDGILLWYTATSCCLFYRTISYNFVWFFSTFMHVLACVFTVSAMASPLLGSVGEFDPASETFTAFFERLEHFFVANGIRQSPADATAAVVQESSKKKVAVMISVIGKKTYGTLRDLCSPKNPKEKTFEAIIELLQQHFKPKWLEVAESYRFHRCFQEENESVSSYSARLRHLASTCNFGEFLNRSLRDQFVCGIRNPATRRKH